MNFTCIDFSYCYNHVQMGIVITKRSDVYIVAFHLLWIVALEPCSQNKYWLGRADGSCVWLFMWGLTWLGSIWPQGWELYKCSYVSINAYTHSTGHRRKHDHENKIYFSVAYELPLFYSFSSFFLSEFCIQIRKCQIYARYFAFATILVMHHFVC